MEGLPPELLAKIQAQKEKLQREFEEYAAKQREAKISDVCSSTGVSRNEAECALNLCENDELEAINRLATEAPFKQRVQDMCKATNETGVESANIVFAARPRYDDDVDSFDSDESPRKRARRKRLSRMKQAQQALRVQQQQQQQQQQAVVLNPILQSRLHMEGFNVDGTPRAPTIRLGDALKRLEEIKKAKSAPSPTKIASSPTPSPSKSRKSPSVLKSKHKVESEEEKTDAVSPSSNDDEPLSTVRRSPRSKQAAETTVLVQQQPVHQDNKQQQQQQQAQKSEDEYTYDDLKSLQWSDARIKAFLGRKSNPNAYYYRFNSLGEEQRTGAWVEDEHKLFMELIKDGVDYHWGIFSMRMPGRVGYQCSNYYRKLIADGVVVDPNYVVDESGKLTFKKGGIKRMRPGGDRVLGEGAESGSVQPTITEAKPKSRPVTGASTSSSSKRRRRPKGRDVEAESRNGLYDEDEEEDDNFEYLLGDTVDSMTMKRMKVPTISPYGHVLNYLTWLRLLKETPVNTCPFTKQRVSRRDLVKLTWENIDDFRSRMIISCAATTTTTAPSATTITGSSPVCEGDAHSSHSIDETSDALMN